MSFILWEISIAPTLSVSISAEEPLAPAQKAAFLMSPAYFK